MLIIHCTHTVHEMYVYSRGDSKATAHYDAPRQGKHFSDRTESVRLPYIFAVHPLYAVISHLCTAVHNVYIVRPEV